MSLILFFTIQPLNLSVYSLQPLNLSVYSLRASLLVPRVGIEPTYHGLEVRRSIH